MLMDDGFRRKEDHPESLDRGSHASVVSSETIDYWIRLRTEARALVTAFRRAFLSCEVAVNRVRLGGSTAGARVGCDLAL